MAGNDYDRLRRQRQRVPAALDWDENLCESTSRRAQFTGKKESAGCGPLHSAPFARDGPGSGIRESSVAALRNSGDFRYDAAGGANFIECSGGANWRSLSIGWEET